MRLYIEHGPLLDKPVAGMFNAHGLAPQLIILVLTSFFQGVANSLIFNVCYALIKIGFSDGIWGKFFNNQLDSTNM